MFMTVNFSKNASILKHCFLICFLLMCTFCFNKLYKAHASFYVLLRYRFSWNKREQCLKSSKLFDTSFCCRGKKVKEHSSFSLPLSVLLYIPNISITQVHLSSSGASRRKRLFQVSSQRRRPWLFLTFSSSYFFALSLKRSVGRQLFKEYKTNLPSFHIFFKLLYGVWGWISTIQQYSLNSTF